MKAAFGGGHNFSTHPTNTIFQLNSCPESQRKQPCKSQGSLSKVRYYSPDQIRGKSLTIPGTGGGYDLTNNLHTSKATSKFSVGFHYLPMVLECFLLLERLSLSGFGEPHIQFSLAVSLSSFLAPLPWHVTTDMPQDPPLGPFFLTVHTGSIFLVSI